MKHLFLFLTVLYLLSSTSLYVCDMCESGLWESLHRQMDPMWETSSLLVGLKGNPLLKEGFTVFISSWTTVGVLKIIFNLKVINRFSIRIHIQMN